MLGFPCSPAWCSLLVVFDVHGADFFWIPDAQAFESRSMRGLKRLAADPMFPATGHKVEKPATKGATNGVTNGDVKPVV